MIFLLLKIYYKSIKQKNYSYWHWTNFCSLLVSFSANSTIPICCSPVPLLITIQFFLIGIGVIKDQASVDAMSRSGDPKEILKGPFYLWHCICLVDNPSFGKIHLIGIIALMILCGGDGFADIIGRRLSSLEISLVKP